MSDRWLGRSEGEGIDDWNTVYCIHIQGNMSTCADTFCIYHKNLPQKGGSYGEKAENFLVYASFL